MTVGEVRSGDQVRKKLFIKTYGCQMNVYDSRPNGGRPGAAWLSAVEPPDAADLVILNTCHIREKAAEKVYSELGRLRRLREARRAGGTTCCSRSPAASPRPKARWSAGAVRRHGVRAAGLSSPARDGGPPGARPPVRCSTPISRSSPNSTSCRRAPAPQGRSRRSSPSRRAATSSAPSASCPIRAAPK